MDDLHYIERAVSLALTHSHDGLNGPFGAVIVSNDRIIAEGWNQVVTANDPTAHAEIVAIRNACASIKAYVLDGCTLYCSCEPCPMCLAAVYWARISRVVYAATGDDAAGAGFDDVVILNELKKDRGDKSIRLVYLPVASAKKVFADWVRNENKIRY